MEQETISSLVTVYDTLAEAEEAVRRLADSGFPIEQVSIVSQNLESERQVHGFITPGDLAVDGVTTGAWVGGLFGLLLGAAFMWVPGFGPLIVAGPLAAALLGGIEGVVAGAAGGGVLGALAGWGVSRKHILKYEERLKAGKYLMIVHGAPELVDQARTILGQPLVASTSSTNGAR
jgi:uncharacterized membrane protein